MVCCDYNVVSPVVDVVYEDLPNWESYIYMPTMFPIDSGLFGRGYVDKNNIFSFYYLYPQYDMPPYVPLDYSKEDIFIIYTTANGGILSQEDWACYYLEDDYYVRADTVLDLSKYNVDPNLEWLFSFGLDISDLGSFINELLNKRFLGYRFSDIFFGFGFLAFCTYALIKWVIPF